MRVLHFTWALLLILTASASAQPAATTPSPTAYTMFFRGSPVGREDVTIRNDAGATVISGQGRMALPVDVLVRNAETRYRSDWTPESFVLDAAIGGSPVVIRTNFADGNAVTSGAQAGKTIAVTTKVSPQTMVMPNGLFAAFEFAAIARRLAAGTNEFRIFALPVVEIAARVTDTHDERIQVGTSIFDVKRYDLVFENPTGTLAVSLTAGADGSLIRVSIPTQLVELVRNDVASSISRTQVYSNPGDEAVLIPAVGFNLGATVTRPRGATPPNAKLPAVILLAGSGVEDRDGIAFGVATLAQLAGALADSGFLVVRYDKRGFGQSGGRAESATLSDFADDASAVVKWLAARKDVDPKRIALVGHSEGAAVALLAASHDKKIAAVVSVAGPSTTGADLILEQQRYALDQQKVPEPERAAKIAEQKQIQSAVLSGRGWEGIPAGLRK